MYLLDTQGPIILEIYYFLDETSRVQFYRTCSRIRNIIREFYINKACLSGGQGFLKCCSELDVIGAYIISEKLSVTEIFSERTSEFINSMEYSESGREQIRCLGIATRNRRSVLFNYRILYHIVAFKAGITSEEVDQYLKTMLKGYWIFGLDSGRINIIRAFIKVCILFRNPDIFKNIFDFLDRWFLIHKIVDFNPKTAADFLKGYREKYSISDRYLIPDLL